MQKPSFRFFIVPLGAICTLATLASQNPQLQTQRDSGFTTVRQQVVDCSTRNPSEVCVISPEADRAR